MEEVGSTVEWLPIPRIDRHQVGGCAVTHCYAALRGRNAIAWHGRYLGATSNETPAVHANPITILPSARIPPTELSPADRLSRLESRLQELPLRRRAVQPKQVVFRSGQASGMLYLVHAGFFKTTVASTDGREKITGFHLRGDLLGLDSIGLPGHACDAVALETGEVWELPIAHLQAYLPDFMPEIIGLLASEVRRDWRWMLDTSSLNAEQRVISFLLDLGTRLQALGFSRYDLRLRMTRAELGNFLSLQLETVTRALSKLAAAGLIAVDGREVRLQDPTALQRMVAMAA